LKLTQGVGFAVVVVVVAAANMQHNAIIVM